MDYFVTKVETPVEREIRLAKEREEEFRRFKGLPPKPDSATREVEVVVETTRPRPSPVSRHQKVEEEQKGSMKRYTSGVLQSEMEAEKQREMDLRRLGKINTTSEERSEVRKYKETVPSEGPVTPNYKASNTKTAEVRTPVEVKPSPVKTHSEVKTQPEVKVTAKSKANYLQSNRTVYPSVNGSMSSPTTESAPVVMRKANPAENPAKRPESFTFRRSANVAESKIEQELREMKEREADLRYNLETISFEIVFRVRSLCFL